MAKAVKKPEAFAPERLKNKAAVAKYLATAAGHPDPDVFTAALNEVAKAYKVMTLARDSGLGAKTLYKVLTPGKHPRHETLNAVLHTLGVKFTVVAARG